MDPIDEDELRLRRAKQYQLYQAYQKEIDNLEENPAEVTATWKGKKIKILSRDESVPSHLFNHSTSK
jgi:hypothetical protein